MGVSNPERIISKVVIMGLDNSGKTSILLSLQKTTNLLSYFSLKPTQGLNIVKLQEGGHEFSIWDLGGQQKYREDYLKNLQKFTGGANKIIFVIDVQDVARYEAALKYLSAIVERLKDDKVEFSIFLHKFDPGIEEIAKYSTEKLSKTLLNRINTIIPEKYKYHIFKTTIFTVFQKTMLQ